ncbi:MAG: hypothetical protein JO265_03475 [Acidimicrobiia bacterium]|nr:hypothetical protein [Acidimicrobiia bacterium]
MRGIRPFVLVAAGLVLAAAFGFRVATARADTTLGSYSVIASAPGIEVIEDEPAAQAHPEGQGSAPYTTSLISGGGRGYALSSIAWPGAYGGNAGSLILVAIPSQAGGVPVPDAVNGAVQTVSPSLQYPIRAEARTPSAPDASYGQIPGTTLTAHADASDSHAVADVQGAQQPGVATYGNMHSDSSSTLTGSTVKALADSVLHNVDLAGVVKIKSLTSTATATADGSTSAANGGTVLDGLTVGGQPASLDQDGLHIGTANQPANAIASQAANQALAGAGMKIFASEPQVDRTNGTTSYTAASFVFEWAPPGDPSQNTFMVTLGGARVSVAAGQGFDVASPAPADTGAGAAATGTNGGQTAALGTTTASGGPTGSTGGASGLATAGSGSGSPGQGPQVVGGQTIAATFTGLGAGWLLVALAAAALFGYGSHRLLADLVDRPPAACPLEVPR